MINYLKILFAPVILVSVISYSQIYDDNALGLLQAKFDSIESFSVDFIHSNNGNEDLSGVFFFKKENNIKIIAGKLNIVSNGNISWNFNKAENKVIISNVDENEPGIFSLNEIVYNFPEECNIIFENDGQRKITLIPNGYKYNFDSVNLWLNDDNLISKLLINDSAIGQTGITFFNYNLDRNLPASEFTFTPPEGSKIIDLR